MTPLGNLAVVTETATPEPDTGIPADTPITFDRGMFGFADNRDFVLASTSRDGLFWMQSTENEALCFVLADPFRFFPGYAVDLADIDAAYLGANEPDDIAILVTVTLSDRRDRASTANLQGPIAINMRNRRARQVISHQSHYGVREILDLNR